MTFPVDVLRPGDSALDLFSAAFGGAQSAAYLRDAGLTEVICVDEDIEKLEAMRPKFPTSWRFYGTDAFFVMGQFVTLATTEGGNPFGPDVVVSDPWAGDLDAKMRQFIPCLLNIAQRVLVYGVGNAARDAAIEEFRAVGHEPRVVERSALASWLVVERS